jgi:hypothetical protein
MPYFRLPVIFPAEDNNMDFSEHFFSFPVSPLIPESVPGYSAKWAG